MNRLNDISEELHAIDCSVLATLSQEMPYQVPDNYFQSLPSHIAEFIQAENEAYVMLPPVSATPFSVPEHYFDSLADNIMANIKSQTEKTNTKKVIPFTPAVVQWSHVRWAAAAILLIMMGVTASIRHSLSAPAIEHQLSVISGAALNEYALLHSDEIEYSVVEKNATEARTPQLNDDDIVQYLNEYPLSPTETNL